MTEQPKHPETSKLLEQHKHPKNELQEIFQKLKLPRPTYSSEIIAYDAGKSVWLSSVTLYDGRSFQGNKCSNRIEAEASAATVAREQYLRRTAVLVDVASAPRFIDLMNIADNYTVYAFIREGHFLATKEFPPGVISITSPQPLIHMSMTLGIMLHLQSFEEYIIVTAAPYGSTLTDMISQSFLGWKPKPARVITSIDEL